MHQNAKRPLLTFPPDLLRPVILIHIAQRPLITFPPDLPRLLVHFPHHVTFLQRSLLFIKLTFRC